MGGKTQLRSVYQLLSIAFPAGRLDLHRNYISVLRHDVTESDAGLGFIPLRRELTKKNLA
jgi:hypothetical protein